MVTQSASDRGKSASAFRTIGEVSLELDLPQHVLRFWESKFNRLRPMKRGGGRRYYRPEDIELLKRIKQLLYEDGYTIKGVQKLLREGSSGKTDGHPDLSHAMDLMFLVMLGGRTRTGEQYAALLGRAKFRLVKTIPTGSDVTVLEAIPV